jgi:hypothetical protein
MARGTDMKNFETSLLGRRFRYPKWAPSEDQGIAEIVYVYLDRGQLTVGILNPAGNIEEMGAMGLNLQPPGCVTGTKEEAT